MKIKFRAKVKENGKKRMFYQNDQYLVSFLRRVTSFLAFEHDSKEGKHESYLDDYALEKCLDPFTGLLDKNGKEIYEGDKIIHPQYPTPLVVQWDYDQWGLFDGVCNEASINGDIEIIGNIYEEK